MKLTLRALLALAMAAILSLAPALSAQSAHALTYKQSITGSVTCSGGGKVVGIWVQSSAGGSRWTNTLTVDPVFKNHATFTATFSTTSRSTSVRLDIGCGGDSVTWKSNNSTPSVTVAQSGTITATCKEKAGSRAERCKLLPNPVAATVLDRAKGWVTKGIAYNQGKTYAGYRQDCSGFVSMAWGLTSGGKPASYTTGTLPQVAVPIAKADLRPGDILLNTAAGNAGHVVIFVRWADAKKTTYVAYEENGALGKTVQVSNMPYPYWPGNGSFQPYRKK